MSTLIQESPFSIKMSSMSSKNIEQKNGDKLSPWRTPNRHLYASRNLLCILTLDFTEE